MVELLLDGVTWEVRGVGGERGRRDTIWMNVERTPEVVAERRRIDGVETVVFTVGVSRSGRRRTTRIRRPCNA